MKQRVIQPSQTRANKIGSKCTKQNIVFEDISTLFSKKKKKLGLGAQFYTRPSFCTFRNQHPKERKKKGQEAQCFGPVFEKLGPKSGKKTKKHNTKKTQKKQETL